jgi:hypothetical protein
VVGLSSLILQENTLKAWAFQTVVACLNLVEIHLWPHFPSNYVSIKKFQGICRVEVSRSLTFAFIKAHISGLNCSSTTSQ